MERQVEFVLPLHQTELPPYGKVNSFTIKTPDGAWLEFYEKLDV